MSKITTAHAVQLLVLTLCLSLWHPPAQAALISMDLAEQNDGLLTFDTDTGLEWLDLTETADLSINQVLAGGFVTVGFFRYVSSDELRTLYLNAGITEFLSSTVEKTTDSTQIDATRHLIALLGDLRPTNGSELAEGYASLDEDFFGFASRPLLFFSGGGSDPFSQAILPPRCCSNFD